MKNFIHTRNESIAATWNTGGNAQPGKSARDLAAGPVRFSWKLARFQTRGIGNVPQLLGLLRATFIQPFMQIVHRLTVWCDTHEPNAAYRLGAWEMLASGLARELAERSQAAENDRTAEKVLCLQAEQSLCSEQKLQMGAAVK